MTDTAARVGGHRDGAVALARPRWWHRAGWPLVVLGVVVVAAVLRLVHVQTAYELFIDEVSYADLSANVAGGRGVVLDGGPFDLHPPLFFFAGAALLLVRGTDLTDPLAAVAALRPAEAVVGALTCGLVALLVARVVPGTMRSRVVGAACGLLVALDPFVNRFDSRVLLEAPAMLLTLAGLLLITRVLDEPARFRRVLAAGMVLGLALLVKETFAFVAVLPLLLTAVALPRTRRALLGAVVTATAVYLGYVLVLLAVGRGGHWAEQKLSGVRRLVGLDQVTGFNKPGSTSFVARAVELFGSYAVTYGVIGLATVLAGLAALEHLTARRRGAASDPHPGLALLVATQLGAAAYLAYAVPFGTLEEQAFYLVVTPSIVVLGLALLRLHTSLTTRQPASTRGSQGSGTPKSRALAGGLAVAVLAVVAVDTGVWWSKHTEADNGYQQYVAWVERTLGPTDRLAVTDTTAEFITPGVVLGPWATPAAIEANQADYVLVNQRLVDQGLGRAAPSLVTWLDDNATVVLDVRTPSVESLRVYEVTR